MHAQPAELPTTALQALKQRAHQLLESHRSLQQQNHGLVAERLGIESERDQLATQLQELSAGRDALLAERDSLSAHLQELTAQRDSIQQERDGLQSERDQLAAQYQELTGSRDALQAERETLLEQQEALGLVRDGLMAALRHVFPYASYRDQRSDLASINDNDLVDHFVNHGIHEGIDIHFNRLLPKAKQLHIPESIKVRLQKSVNQLRLIDKPEIARSIEYYLNINCASDAAPLNPEGPCGKGEPYIVGHGSEGTCVVDGGIVTKIYNADCFRYNRSYRRFGEAAIIKELPKSFKLQLLHSEESFMSMPYYGMAVGERIAHQYDTKKCFLNGDDILRLIRWLLKLEGLLIEGGVIHNDINLCNILFDTVSGKFTLIDFTWASLNNNAASQSKALLSDNPPYLNHGLGGDKEAIQDLIRFLIRRLTFEVGSKGYRDGSSVTEGFVYCKLPFEEFSDIPHHKNHAEKEFEDIAIHAGDSLKNARVLEIGSAVGEFTFRLARVASHVTAIEADNFACRIAEALRLYKNIDNISFYRASAQDFLAKFESCYEICLCINVHMWIEKQLGKEKTIELFRRLSRNVHHLYFQTAHRESGGMYLVEYLRNAEDIVQYLVDCGFRSVEQVSSTSVHGGERILFYCQGNSEI